MLFLVCVPQCCVMTQLTMIVDPESGLPSIVPNTIAEEPSVPPETASQSQEAPARKKLTRRVTSRQASADPSERPLVEEPQSEPQRKGPRRVC